MKKHRWCAVGIDPGKSGGIAFLYDNGTVRAQKLDTSDPVAVADALPPLDTLNTLRTGLAIEKVTAMTLWGKRQHFTFGQALGVPKGVAVALGYPVTLLPPKVWQKVVSPEGVPSDKKQRKAYFQGLVLEKWDLPLPDGPADALLIAYALAHDRFYCEG